MSDEAAGVTALPAETGVGRVGLRVDDHQRVLPFYRDVVGCRVERADSIARLSATGGRELLVVEEVPGASPRPPSAAGLFHVAFRLPDRPALADALARIRASGGSLVGASDHLVSEALYLQDPAGNGVEIYRDRPRESWDRLADGRVAMDTRPLDIEDLIEAGDGSAREGLPPRTDVGHVHLEVTDLAAAAEFYVDGLGLRPSSQDVRGARFLSAGGYHHHVAVNVWQRRSDPRGEHQGLVWFELVLPDGPSRDAAVDRLERHGYDVTGDDGVPAVSDPDGVRVRLVVRDEPA